MGLDREQPSDASGDRDLVELQTSRDRNTAKELAMEATKRVLSHPEAVTTKDDLGETTIINTPNGEITLSRHRFKTGEEGIHLMFMHGKEKDGQGEWSVSQDIEWVIKGRSLLWNWHEKVSVLGHNNRYLLPREVGSPPSTQEKVLNKVTSVEGLRELQKEILVHLPPSG